MLTAIVLQLRAKADGQIQGSTGRAGHGFWLKQWQETNPTMSYALHQDYPIKPFSVSPIMGLPLPVRGVQHIPAGQPAWIRFTSLHPALSQAIYDDWLPQLPPFIHLADIAWELVGVDENHPWAGRSSYAALTDQCQEERYPAGQWHLEFQTPTTFRVGQDDHLPFPLPELLLTSWLRRWQAFSAWGIDEATMPALRDHLLVNHYELKTVPVRQGKRLTIGCVGHFSFQASNLPAESRAIISLLARFAFFCGSGYHTTQGLGLTRLLERGR